jgi:DNA polymerase zeta
LQRQWSRILTGRYSLQDFIIAKAVKLGTYSERGLPPPGAYLALKRMREDHRREPQYGERVPYIVAFDGPNARLVDSARSPEDFASDE